MTVTERIDEARKRWNVLDHPFYLRWERGDLSRDELAFYAGEYRHAVVALAGAAAATGDAEHAKEESDHVALWDEFAAALDAPLDREATAESRGCADAWDREDALEARAVLYAIESGQPTPGGVPQLAPGNGKGNRAKPFVDTFVYRSGDLLGVWAPTALAALAIPVGLAAVGCSGLWLGSSLALGRRVKVAGSQPPD